jgi:hypothetical protein
MLLHTIVDGLPTGDARAMVPIELTPIGVRMVPNGLAGIDIVVLGGVIVAVPLAMDVETVLGTADIVGVMEIDSIVPAAPPIAEMEMTGMAGVPDAICGIGVAHVTNVPGVAGLDANGTGASVVTGVSAGLSPKTDPGR